MATFEITLTNRSVELIEGADAYQQEGPMTTFFCSDTDHGRLDAWSVRLASVRTAEVAMIRRLEGIGARRPTLEVVAGIS